MNDKQKSKEKDLRPKQEAALELAAAGVRDAEIARQVGVTRQSVNRWRNQDSTFIRTLEERRLAMRDEQMARLSDLLDLAMDVIEGELRGEDARGKRQAALAVLKVSGLQGYAKPPKPLSKAEAEQELISEILGEIAEELGFRMD